MGSTFIQVADVITESGWRRTVADDSSEDESLEVQIHMHMYIHVHTYIHTHTYTYI